MIDAAGLLKKTFGKSKPKEGRRPRPETGQSPIAIDFGVSGLKVVQLVGGARVSVLAFEPTPEGVRADPVARLTAQLESLAGWSKAGVFKGRRAVCSLPAGLVTVRHLQVEKIAGLDPCAAARHSMAEHVGCPADHLVHRSVEVGPVLAGATGGGGQKLELISIAAPRAGVDRLVSRLRSIGLDPVGMHAPALALSRAFGDAGENDEPVMVVDLGAGQTTAVVIDGGRPTVIRVFPVGGDAIDEALCETLKVDAESVRRARRVTGSFSPERIADHLRRPTTYAEDGDLGGVPVDTSGAACRAEDIVADLGEELSIAVRYHRGLFPARGVRRVVFTGGGAQSIDVCRSLAERLGLAAQVGDPVAAMPREDGVRCEGIDSADPTPALAVSAGLAQSPTDL